jgi:hypothetical protein
VALNQNYFQYNDIFQTNIRHSHGVTLIKYPSRDLFTVFQGNEGQTLDGNGEITYYRRYVGDIIFDQSKINEDLITTSTS